MAVRLRADHGAVAVEFALVFTLVLAPVLLGIIQFGWGYEIQSTLSAAAREGVRTLAITNSEKSATSAVNNTLTAASITGASITITYAPAPNEPVSPTSCAPGRTTTVRVTYPFAAISAYFPSITLTGSGVMLCGG